MAESGGYTYSWMGVTIRWALEITVEVANFQKRKNKSINVAGGSTTGIHRNVAGTHFFTDFVCGHRSCGYDKQNNSAKIHGAIRNTDVLRILLPTVTWLKALVYLKLGCGRVSPITGG